MLKYTQDFLYKNTRQPFIIGKFSKYLVKIFEFSKLDLSKITGKFKKGSDGKPVLFTFPDGSLRDDNLSKVNQLGYLIDDEGNIVDRNGSILLEKNLLSSEGKLP